MKKELEPIISDDDMKNAAQTEGIHLSLLGSFLSSSVHSLCFLIKIPPAGVGERYNQIAIARAMT